MGASSASVKSDFVAIGRVPVVSASGERLMPCKPSKAKKLLEAGKAEEKQGTDGLPYIQLKFDPSFPVPSSQTAWSKAASQMSSTESSTQAVLSSSSVSNCFSVACERKGVLTGAYLARVREEAKRRRVWYRFLPKFDRDVLDLTIKCVGELKSARLIGVVSKIVSRLKDALQTRLSRLMLQVGVPKARRLCEFARGWGNRSAENWASDMGFVRYLTVMDSAFQGRV